MKFIDEFKIWMKKHLEEPFFKKEIYSAEIMSGCITGQEKTKRG